VADAVFRVLGKPDIVGAKVVGVSAEIDVVGVVAGEDLKLVAGTDVGWWLKHMLGYLRRSWGGGWNRCLGGGWSRCGWVNSWNRYNKNN
jgi:hypothetical protein